MKLLAIDFGMKRLGFAMGNATSNTSAPLNPLTYKNTKQAITHIKQLIDEYDISTVLLGYPLNMDGSKSKTTQQVEQFKTHLGKILEPGVAIEYVDERLSSFD